MRYAAIACLLLIFLSSNAHANGSGLDYRPIIKDCTAVRVDNDYTVHLGPGRTVRPIERLDNGQVLVDGLASEVILSSDCLPEETAGLESYAKRQWAAASTLLESEAGEESNFVVKTWKLIIAGNSYIMNDQLDEGLRCYEAASQVEPENVLTPAAYHVISQWYYEKGNLSKTLELLKYIKDNYGYAGSRENKLLRIDVLSNKIIDHAFFPDQMARTISEEWAFLDCYLARIRELDRIVACPAEKCDAAAALYEKAILRQHLHAMFSSAPGSYFYWYSEDTRRMMNTLVENFEGSGWDDNAFWNLKQADKPDYEGDYESLYSYNKAIAEEMLARYPNTDLRGHVEAFMQRSREDLEWSRDHEKN